ncbi:MAG TPA: TRAP transporter substrate-binding protein DctP, partial [Polyangiaceae bacterium]
MLRRALVTLSVALVCASLSPSARAGTTLKLGTLAPGDSPWGREFKAWAAAVSADTNGELSVDIAWNGQAGDEKLMVEKIRSGQLDGAAVTAMGLAQTGVMDVLAFELPGVFTTWGKLDRARDAVKDELAKEFEAKGFTLLGWGDVGAAKTMSIGFE